MNTKKFYIDGTWVSPHGESELDVINPATENPIARIALGDETDIDRAVRAARAAFADFSRTSKQERVDLLRTRLPAAQRHSRLFLHKSTSLLFCCDDLWRAGTSSTSRSAWNSAH